MMSERSVSQSAGASPGYTALLESAGLIDDSCRVLIRVTGEQAAEMLHGLTTNDVKGLSSGQGTYAFMLTPKGRVVAEMRVIRVSEEFWLDLPAPCLDSALAHLRKYLPPMFAVFEQTDRRRLSVVGPRALEVLDSWAGETNVELGPLRGFALQPEGTDGFLMGREAIEGPGFDVYVASASREEALWSLEAATNEVGGTRSDETDWGILRVELGIPVWGLDFTDNELAQEVAQDERAISFEKGCYTGQEVVARIHFRGHVNRILRGFRLPRPDLSPGQALYEADRKRAVLGSVVVSPRLGPLGLGLARTELPPGTRLALEPSGEPLVELVELPFG